MMTEKALLEVTESSATSAHASARRVLSGTMESTADNDGGERSNEMKCRGRGKAWLPEENVGVVLSACQLPDASIDGASLRAYTYEQKMFDQFVKQAPSLAELPDQSKVWRGRSPRSCHEQRRKIIKDCTSLQAACYR
jgi:hypothetical protein